MRESLRICYGIGLCFAATSLMFAAPFRKSSTREKIVHCNILPRFVFLFLLSIMISVGRAHADEMAQAIAEAEKSVLAGVPKAEKDLTRPVFHFRPPARWMNDTCGAIFYKGYYHIFYQLNPYGDTWGGTWTGWGHTRSKDLVAWEHLPIALAPLTERGQWRCNSGCVTLNGDGTPMIFYTFVPSRRDATKLGKREQWAAIACDEELRTWRLIKENPLLAAGMNGVPEGVDAGWSDPFIFRAGNRTLVTFKQCDGLIAEAENTELTQWKCVGRIDGIGQTGECPNFFKLQDKWVLLTSAFLPLYKVGMFDHKQIQFDFDKGKSGTLDYGYGPKRPRPWARGLAGTNVLFDDKERCILFGWLSGFKLGKGWAGCMALPRILRLGPDGHPVQIPVPELEKLRGKHAKAGKLTLKNESRIIDGVGGDTLEVLARFVVGDAKKFGLRLRPSGGEEGVIELACDGKTFDAAGTQVPDVVDAKQRTMTLHVFFDKSAMELFINGGRKVVSRVVYPGSQDLRVELFSERGSVTVMSVDAWEIGSIW